MPDLTLALRLRQPAERLESIQKQQIYDASFDGQIRWLQAQLQAEEQSRHFCTTYTRQHAGTVGLASACTERMLRLRQCLPSHLSRTIRQPRCIPLPCYALAPGYPSGKLRVALQFDKPNRAQRCADSVLPFRIMRISWQHTPGALIGRLLLVLVSAGLG